MSMEFVQNGRSAKEARWNFDRQIDLNNCRLIASRIDIRIRVRRLVYQVLYLGFETLFYERVSMAIHMRRFVICCGPSWDDSIPWNDQRFWRGTAGVVERTQISVAWSRPRLKRAFPIKKKAVVWRLRAAFSSDRTPVHRAITPILLRRSQAADQLNGKLEEIGTGWTNFGGTVLENSKVWTLESLNFSL